MKTEIRDQFGSVRDDLAGLIGQLDRDFRLLSVGELCRRVDRIRRMALNANMVPLARLAAGLADALAEGGRGVAARPYLDGMRDAVGCEPQDEATASVFLAAVGVRLAG